MKSDAAPSSTQETSKSEINETSAESERKRKRSSDSQSGSLLNLKNKSVLTVYSDNRKENLKKMSKKKMPKIEFFFLKKERLEFPGLNFSRLSPESESRSRGLIIFRDTVRVPCRAVTAASCSLFRSFFDVNNVYQTLILIIYQRQFLKIAR